MAQGKFGLIWVILGLILGLFGLIWTNFDFCSGYRVSFGTSWTYLGLFDFMWGYF